MIREFLDQLDTLQARIRRGHAVNINDRETKEGAIALASAYFAECRKPLLAATGDGESLRSHDENWQELIRLAHGNNSRRSYLNLLKTLHREMAELSIIQLSHLAEQATPASAFSDISPAERLIIETLETSIPSAAASYRQALLDLRASQRLSYRGTASELREALRETLDHLASDKDVMEQPGFVLEDKQTKPTMKQKAQYILAVRGRSRTKRMLTE